MIDFSKVITAEMRVAEAQASLRAQVSIERDRRIAAGAVVSIPDYGDVPIQGGGSHDRNMQ